jgi:hypothetical protein
MVYGMAYKVQRFMLTGLFFVHFATIANSLSAEP